MIFENILDQEIVDELNKDYKINLNTSHNNIYEVIAWMKVISKHLIQAEHTLLNEKLVYENEFNNLCLSKEYETRFKTIKAREQQASTELVEKQEFINQLKMLVKMYNAEMEILRHEFKLLEADL